MIEFEFTAGRIQKVIKLGGDSCLRHENRGAEGAEGGEVRGEMSPTRRGRVSLPNFSGKFH